jgi:hypothetical protein
MMTRYFQILKKQLSPIYYQVFFIKNQRKAAIIQLREFDMVLISVCKSQNTEA